MLNHSETASTGCNELYNLLNSAGLKIDKVGTVHSLQGAERSIVIFSTITTAQDKGTYFF